MAGIDDAIDAARGAKKAGSGVASTGVQQPVVAPQQNGSVVQQTPLQKQIAADPYPTVDPNASIGQHLLSATQQVGRGVANVARVGTDALTRGLYDKNQADPDAARAKTQQASEELGTGGNLGIRTMASIPGRIFKGGGLLKAGVEGGISGAADAYGHGGSNYDIAMGGATGFGVASGLSGAGQAVAQGVRKLGQTQVGTALKTAIEKFGDKLGVNPTTPADVTQNLKSDADVKFKKLDQNTYNPAHVGNVADGVDNALLSNPVSRTNSPGTDAALQKFRQDIWNKAGQGQSSSAGDVHTVIKQLNEVSGRGGFDGSQAKQASDMFEKSLAGLPTTNGAPASEVVKQFNDAKAAHGLFKNSEALEGMNQDLGTYGTMPGPAAKKMVQDNPQFYNPDQTTALKGIANSGQSPGMVPWFTGGAAAAGYGLGHPYMGALAGGAYDATKQLATPAGARRAVYNAYPAMTGQAPKNPEEMTSEALKRIGIGGLSGAGTPNPIDMIPGSAKPWIMPYLNGQ